MNGRFISYLRVSTDKQGKSGLGLEAQRESVLHYLNGGSWTLLAEVIEVETGKNDERPALAKAINQCRMTGSTLIVAKLDRLSRDAAFLLTLNKSGIDIRCADMPDMNTMTFGIMAVMAQHEREMISKRTKEALAVVKARGVKMGGFRGYVPDAAKATEARRKAADGFAAMVGPMVSDMRAKGLTLREIAAKLTADGVQTARGGVWTATAVKNVLERFG